MQKVKLGGKSYAPSENHPFAPYSPAFCQFVELMDKLNTRIEDDKEPEVALRKISNMIKMQIYKNNTGKLKTSHLDKISDSIMEAFSFSTERLEKIQNWLASKHDGESTSQQFLTPKRTVGCGGSVVGRKNRKAIRNVVDYFSASAVLNPPINLHVMLGKIKKTDCEINRSPSISSPLSDLASPTSFPTVISLFKTPDVNVGENDDIAEDSLGKRLGLDKVLGVENDSKKTKLSGIPKFQAQLTWAEETSPIIASPMETREDNRDAKLLHNEETTYNGNVTTPIAPSKTSNIDIAEVIQEAKDEAEKALREAKQGKRAPKVCTKRSILKDINKVNRFPLKNKNSEIPSADDNKSSKRIKISGSENLPPPSSTNKNLVTKKSQSSKSKKIVAPLKGQMKMTAFLRM